MTAKRAPKAAARRPKALHSDKKSGYTHDIAPERALTGMPGTPVPPAYASGRQPGRMTTTEQVEAILKRNKQGPPPVKTMTVAEMTAARKAAKAREETEIDPDGELLEDTVTLDPEDYETPGDFDPFKAETLKAARNYGQDPDEEYQRVAEERRDIQQLQPPVVQERSRATVYLEQRKRVSLELSDATLFMSAIDVVKSPYGVTLLLPAGDSTTCIPKPGSQVVLGYNGETVPCYFPGGYFDIEELGLLGLPFVRADGEG